MLDENYEQRQFPDTDRNCNGCKSHSWSIHEGERRITAIGKNAGDFDLAVAEDGKAYYYFERVHSETICADLTEDYTDVTGYYSTHFPRKHPPYVREATAHFKRKGKHYLITSGTTGYLPNPSEVAVADTWHGPYKVLGNPHVGDESQTSFHSQISCIFKVEGKKIYTLRVQIDGCHRIWIKNIQFMRKCLTVFIQKKRKNLILAAWERNRFRIHPLQIMYGYHFVLMEIWFILTGKTSGE